MKMATFFFLLSLTAALSSSMTAAWDKPKNVLFIISDDFRPEIQAGYGQSHMITPNLDKLVKESLVFQRAYCQHAVCIPSRNSFMTGRRPDTTKVWIGIGNRDFRVTGPDWVSLPEHFKNNGYTTLGGGKTYHPGHPPNWDEPKSWSQDQPYFPLNATNCPKHSTDSTKNLKGEVSKIDTWCPLSEKKYPDSYHFEYRLASHTIDTLKYVSKKGGPWFVAAGFYKPHVPWVMPQRFWDMYENVSIPAVLHRNRPINSPDIAFHNQGFYLDTNGTEYLPMPTPFPLEIQQEARRAYMAAVSWVDSQIGRVLDALESMGLANDTLIVLFGDHGFQLGEHDSWHKQTNWELAARVPMIIRAPWKPASQGKNSYALVESVDLYRTIAELAGAPKPSDDVEGTSFAPLFDNPDLTAEEAASVLNKTAAAYSQYPRCVNNASAQWDDNSCSNDHDVPTYMGYSIRTPEWRYTSWMSWDREAMKAKWYDKPYALELYDHRDSGNPDSENDFNLSDVENIAAQNEDIVEQLQAQLKTFFDK